VSAGNPFYALELGRVLGGAQVIDDHDTFEVPPSLDGLVGKRLDDLDHDAGEVALYAAAASHPTTDLISASVGEESAHHGLEVAAASGVLVVDGMAVRFRIRCSPRPRMGGRRLPVGASSIRDLRKSSPNRRSERGTWREPRRARRDGGRRPRGRGPCREPTWGAGFCRRVGGASRRPRPRRIGRRDADGWLAAQELIVAGDRSGAGDAGTSREEAVEPQGGSKP
jgi:hypothetical protein